MKLLYGLIFFCLSSLLSYGQGTEPLGPPVTGNFERLRLEEFARQLEAQTAYRLFF